MCEDCEQAQPLREIYLARRARMAKTWRPKGPGRWSADAVVQTDVPASPQPDEAPKLIAAE